MLAEAEAGKIGTIIVKDMSRFCRNYLEVGFYTEILFPKKQIRFIAINNSVDSDKPQDNDFTPAAVPTEETTPETQGEELVSTLSMLPKQAISIHRAETPAEEDTETDRTDIVFVPYYASVEQQHGGHTQTTVRFFRLFPAFLRLLGRIRFVLPIAGIGLVAFDGAFLLLDIFPTF